MKDTRCFLGLNIVLKEELVKTPNCWFNCECGKEIPVTDAHITDYDDDSYLFLCSDCNEEKEYSMLLKS